MTQFGDAATAANLIGVFDYVALYGSDCAYPCPHDVAVRWPVGRRHVITQAGDAGCIIADWEPGTALYADPALLRAWADGRTGPLIVYSDPSDVQSAFNELGPHAARAFWWLTTIGDGIEYTAADLAATTGLDEKMIWANQWEGGPDAPYDTSNLFGTWWPR